MGAQGYKFNIFYPDLIDRDCTPIYKLLPVEGNPEQVIAGTGAVGGSL